MENDIPGRTLRFATRIGRLVDALPRRPSGRVIADQLMRSAASVGANCREARRSRTRAEFRSKVNIALQECEEAAYWLELVVELELMEPERLAPLRTEAGELQAILTAALLTMKRR